MAASNGGESALPESADDRAVRIAEIAAQLALIQSRSGLGSAQTGSAQTGSAQTSNAQTGSAQTGNAQTAGAQSGAARNPVAADAGPEEARGGSGRSGTGGRWPSAAASRRAAAAGGPVAIGSSGSTPREPAEPGGHPEDALGDPEAAAKAICLRLLTGQARPRAGLATALRQRGIPDDVADRVLDRFTDLGLIDDQAYAEMFVAAKHRDRALGATALRNELRRKGLDEVVVDEAVRAVDADAERDRAAALIDRRVDAAMVNGIQTARRRLVGLLARRGYSAEVASSVVEQALADYSLSQPADSSWPD